MKALTDRLFWVRAYLVGELTPRDGTTDPGGAHAKQIALDELLGAMAIAEVLPELEPPTLRFEPGDTLVVKYSGFPPLTAELADRIKRHVEMTAGNVPVMVIGPEIELAVLAPAEVEATTRPHRPIRRVIDLPPED